MSSVMIHPATCFACKMRGGKSYGACSENDDESPVLKKAREVDAPVLGNQYNLLIVASPCDCRV